MGTLPTSGTAVGGDLSESMRILDKLAPHCYSQDRDALDQHNEEWFSVTTRLRGALAGLGNDQLPNCWKLAREGGRQIDEKGTLAIAWREVADALTDLYSNTDK